jgi:hypothetical protein
MRNGYQQLQDGALALYPRDGLLCNRFAIDLPDPCRI